VPKALRELAGEALLVHAVRNLSAAPSSGLIVVAAPPSEIAAVKSLLGAFPLVRVVSGGETRQASVARALAVVPAEFDLVLVHDAARCLAPPDLVEAVAAAVRSGSEAVVPVLPVIDTIKTVTADEVISGTVDRSMLRAVQTTER
jgi:2-C-methyl-D-erythritol 4-phosphate cytidylyltransferase